MSVMFDVLDENFKVLYERKDACFSALYKFKGVYISFYPAMRGDYEEEVSWEYIPETPEIKQFYLDMLDLWQDFLVNPDPLWGKDVHVVMDMRKYSYNCILSVMTSFRYITENPKSVDLYCGLRNTYPLTILQALVFCASAIKSTYDNHCLVPNAAFSGEDFISSVLSFNWDEVLERIKKEKPISFGESSSPKIFKTWGDFPRDYYNSGDNLDVLFSFLDEEVESAKIHNSI